MKRSAESDRARQRDQKPRRGRLVDDLGGAAVANVGTAIATPLLIAGPRRLYESLSTGERIPSELHGEPIERIPQFSPEARRAIRGFAAAQKVDLPILGGPESYYSRRPTSALAKELLGIKQEPFVPHISLARASVPQAMHEIGHATRPLFGSLSHALDDASRGWPAGVARLALLAGALRPPSDDTSDARRFVYDHAPALMAATFLPQLVEEGRATLKALQGARAHGPGIGAAARELVPAFGTYVATAAAPALATALAQRLVRYLYDRAEKREKHAAAESRLSGQLKATAASAWRLGSYTKPKTTPPNTDGRPARSMPQAKPPSNRAYHADVTKSMADPARGTRVGLTS